MEFGRRIGRGETHACLAKEKNESRNKSELK
jgi:hypothetical protein